MKPIKLCMPVSMGELPEEQAAIVRAYTGTDDLVIDELRPDYFFAMVSWPYQYYDLAFYIDKIQSWNYRMWKQYCGEYEGSIIMAEHRELTELFRSLFFNDVLEKPLNYELFGETINRSCVLDWMKEHSDNYTGVIDERKMLKTDPRQEREGYLGYLYSQYDDDSNEWEKIVLEIPKKCVGFSLDWDVEMMYTSASGISHFGPEEIEEGRQEYLTLVGGKEPE